MRAVRPMAEPKTRAQPSLACASLIWERLLGSQEVVNLPTQAIENNDGYLCTQLSALAPCYKARAATRARPFRRHETRLHPRQSGARQCCGRQHQDPGRGHLALCALRAAARPQGHGGRAARPRRIHREIFRDGARSAHARICRRDVRLARAGPVGSRAHRPPQGLCAGFFAIRRRPRRLHGTGGAARLPAADLRARPFHGRGHRHPRLPQRQPLVRSRGAVGADDRAAA